MIDWKMFDLTHYEGEILDVLLLERTTLKQLSKKANIPPGKVYSVAKQLLKKGLIEESSTRPKVLFISDPAKILKKLMNQRQERDAKLYAELQDLALSAATVKSSPLRFVQWGVSTQENEEIQLRTFTEAKKQVCQIINVHHKPHSNRRSKSVWEQEIAAAIKRGVIFRCIYPQSVTLPPALQRLTKDKFVVRRLDTDFTRCDIIDGRKVMIKLVHKDPLAFGGIIYLEDERFARNLQKVFEQLWDEADS